MQVAGVESLTASVIAIALVLRFLGSGDWRSSRLRWQGFAFLLPENPTSYRTIPPVWAAARSQLRRQTALLPQAGTVVQSLQATCFPLRNSGPFGIRV